MKPNIFGNKPCLHQGICWCWWCGMRYCLHTRGAVLRERVFIIGHVPTIISKFQVQEMYIQTGQSSYRWVNKDSAFDYLNPMGAPQIEEFDKIFSNNHKIFSISIHQQETQTHFWRYWVRMAISLCGLVWTLWGQIMCYKAVYGY